MLTNLTEEDFWAPQLRGEDRYGGDLGTLAGYCCPGQTWLLKSLDLSWPILIIVIPVSVVGIIISIHVALEKIQQ